MWPNPDSKSASPPPGALHGVITVPRFPDLDYHNVVDV
jgi:hypothetical protein